MQVGENLFETTKIRASLPTPIKINLIKCLKVSIDIFVISLDEVLDFNLRVVSHQLNIDPSIRYGAQRRRQKSPKNVEATRSIIKGFLQVNFISKYIEWLSNIELVKKVPCKLKMSIDYINLNWAFPKDLYLLPNINKLNDNLVGT